MTEDAHRSTGGKHDSSIIRVEHARCVRPFAWSVVWWALGSIAAVGGGWATYLTLELVSAGKVLAVEAERSQASERDRAEMKADLKELLRRSSSGKLTMTAGGGNSE